MTTRNEAVQKLAKVARISVAYAEDLYDSFFVEGEPRYTVRLKGVDGYATHLNQNLDNQEWFFASNDDIKGYRTEHTRKELESNGFGWVFDCPGVEVKEVYDGDD